MSSWKITREVSRRGNGNGEFDNARGISCSHETGNLIIADINNKRIQILSESGEYKTKWPVEINKMKLCPLDVHRLNNEVVIGAIEGHAVMWKCPDVSDYDEIAIELIQSFGNDKFIFPRSVTSDENNIYLTDVGRHCLTSYDFEGRFIKSVGSVGSGDTQFNWPYYMCVDGKGRIAVSDSHNTVVKCFDRDLNFISSFGKNYFTCCCGVSYSESEGGTFVVSDYDTSSLLKFSLDGQFIEYIDQSSSSVLSSVNVGKNKAILAITGYGFREYSKS